MNNCDLTIRKCTKSYIDSILKLQDGVFSDLENHDEILRRNTPEMFLKYLEGKSVTLGLFNSKEIVGLGVLADVAGTEEDMTHSLKNHNGINETVCANLKLVMIRKDYYGMGFQRNIMWILEKMACIYGFQYLCSTVSPQNEYSRRNMLLSGYKYDHTEKKYGGLVRDVMVKQIVNGQYGDLGRRLAECDYQTFKSSDLWGDGNIKNCYQGEELICTTGDLIEFKNNLSETDQKGIIIYNEDRRFILLSNGEVVPFPSEKSGESPLIISKIWINPVAGNSSFV